jgi:hypothetical protein
MKALRLALGFAVFTGLLVWATRPAQVTPPGGQAAPARRETNPASRISISSAAPARAAPVPSQAARDALWKRFRDKFGQELEPRFTPEGRLISVRGRPGHGHGTTRPGFSPEDPRQALARAKEVLEAASELIGVTPDWPLEQPIAKGSKVSAQVYFKESGSGVAIAPFGSVWVDLDSQGGLLGLDSSYVPSPAVVNTENLDPSDAKMRALAAVPDGDSALKVEGGDPVLWVERAPSGVPEARHAYEYYVQGRQVIVDASNGAILHKRDVRQY